MLSKYLACIKNTCWSVKLMKDRYINTNIPHLQIVDVEASAYQVSQNFFLNKRCSKPQTSKLKC